MGLNEYLPSHLGVIPDDWKRVRFSDVMTVRQGLQIAISKRLKVPTANAKEYITIQSINKQDQDREYVEPTSSRVICTKDDVLMTRTGNTGIVVADVEGVFHNNFFLMDFDKTQIEKKFLVNYLRSKRVQHLILTKAGASTIPDLNHKDFYSIEFPLAPLPEQRKIAKILATWDKAISTTERLIDNSKQKKKALMQQLLSGKKRLFDDSGKPFEGEWEEVKLGDLFSLLKSGLSRKLMDENVGVAVIRSNNMGNQFTRNNDLKYWYADDPQGANTQNYLLDDGDILINFINSLSQIGKTCIFREIGDVKSIYTTNILRGKPNTRLVERDYLFYLTKTQRYFSHIKAITKPAVNQASFTTKDFGNFIFKIPDLREQQKISAVLINTDKEIELLEQQLADLKKEKKALMQQLLTGKRRVKVDDEAVA